MLEKCLEVIHYRGFVRGLFGVLGKARGCFWRDYFVFIPYTVVLYVFYRLNVVDEMDILL